MITEPGGLAVPSATAEPPAVPGPDPLQLLLMGWLLSLRSPNTRQAYQRDITDWLGFCAEHRLDPLREVRRLHVDAWAEHLARRLVRGRPLSPATIARRLAAVTSFYRYLLKEGPRVLDGSGGRPLWAHLGALDHNPATDVTRPDVDDEPKGRGLTRAELAALLSAGEAAGPRDAAVACLLGLSGLRVSSVCAATLADRSIEQGHQVLRYTVKGGRIRRTVLHPRTVAALDAHLADRAGRHLELLDGARPRPLVVANDGGPLNRHQARRIVARLARAAGIADPTRVTPHSGRKGFVTVARQAGVPLQDVQHAVDHKDPRTTQLYDHGRALLDSHPTYRLGAFLAET